MNKTNDPLSDGYLDKTKTLLIEKFVAPDTGVSTEAINAAFDSITQLKSAAASANENIMKLYTQLEVIDNARQRVEETGKKGGYMTEYQRNIIETVYDVMIEDIDKKVGGEETVESVMLKKTPEQWDDTLEHYLIFVLTVRRRECKETSNEEAETLYKLLKQYTADMLYPKAAAGGTGKSRRNSKSRRNLQEQDSNTLIYSAFRLYGYT